MLLDFLTTPAKDKPLWMDLLGLLIPIGLAVWGFVRAFKAWERQKKREIDLHLDQLRYERKLEASRGIWPLLAYLSIWGNEKCVFVKHGDKWYFRREQGKGFLKKLPEVFFEQGHGVFIPREARDSLYHFRGIVYKMLDATQHEGSKEELILVRKPEIVEKTVPELFQKINSSLKKMLLDSRIEFSE